jgi:SH3-like domain-containing protein
MLSQIQAALDDVSQLHRDTRMHHCRLEIAAVDGVECILTGTVLDTGTLQTVSSALTGRFGEVVLDTADVRILRPGKLVTVATNLTSLHSEPSFRSEMVSQLLNAQRVELLLEQDRWAYLRQADGYLGWAYRSYMADSPTQDPNHIVCEPVSLLRVAPDPTASLAGRVVGGTAVYVVGQESSWACLSLAGSLEGWIPLADLRSLEKLPQDEASRRSQIIQDAARLTGVPYVWGGCSALGIDCSGMAQLLHRLAGVTIPRDADMQYDAGLPIAPPFQPGDLLFFGGNGDARAITHVGVSVGGWRIVHASRARNGVYQDDVQAVEHLRESFVGARTFLLTR